MNLENFDDVLKHLRTHAAETVKISLSERTKAAQGVREGVLLVGNWDVPQSAAAQASSPLDVTAGEDAEDPDDDLAGQALPAWIMTALAWIKNRAMTHARHYARDAKFQVKLFRAGGSYIVSCTFLVTGTKPEGFTQQQSFAGSYAEHLAQNSPPIEGIIGMDPSTYPAMSEIHGAGSQLLLELMGATGSWLRNLIMPGVGQVLKLSEWQVLRLMQQVDHGLASIKALEGIVKEKDRVITDRDRQILVYEAAEGADVRARIERAKAVEKVADKLGEVGKAYLAGKMGIPPHMMPLLQVIITNKELSDALGDPRIAELLQDPEERAAIVGLLRRLAAAFEENKAKAKAEAEAKVEDAEQSQSTDKRGPPKPSMQADFPDA